MAKPFTIHTALVIFHYISNNLMQLTDQKIYPNQIVLGQ